MSIFSAYVREEWYYSVDELVDLFNLGELNESTLNKIKSYIKALLSRGIIKKKQNKEGLNSSNTIFQSYDDNELISHAAKYKYSFVGIVVFRDIITYVYPKYLGDENSPLSKAPIHEMQQVMNVVEKYGKESIDQSIDLFLDIDDSGSVNVLPVMLFLLDDYARNGAYEDPEMILEINGERDIYWEKTIDETYPIISNNRPYYVELYTRKEVNNDASYFKRLHAYTVTACSKELENKGLANFFNLPLVDISDESVENFGDTNLILQRIEAELSQTYEDRKITVLKAMKAYFQNCQSITDRDELQLIGTKSFNLVWEDVCSQVFDNQRGDVKSGHPDVNEVCPELDYSVVNKWFKNKTPILLDLIDQPIWKKYGRGNKGIATSTFIPDYLKLERRENGDGYVFYIIDAKYYCPRWNATSIDYQPGVEDVAKQYLYYLTFRDLLNKSEITEIKNYFLMPRRSGDQDIKGYVKINMLKNLGLGNIEVRTISPPLLYEKYLDNDHLSLHEII